MKRKHPTACPSPTFWIAERCAIVRRHYRRMRARDLCLILGCTPQALYRQALRMGISKIARRHDKTKI